MPAEPVLVRPVVFRHELLDQRQAELGEVKVVAAGQLHVRVLHIQHPHSRQTGRRGQLRAADLPADRQVAGLRILDRLSILRHIGTLPVFQDT